MVEAAGIEPASRISLIVVVHKFIQFWCNETEKVDYLDLIPPLPAIAFESDMVWWF